MEIGWRRSLRSRISNNLQRHNRKTVRRGRLYSNVYKLIPRIYRKVISRRWDKGSIHLRIGLGFVERNSVSRSSRDERNRLGQVNAYKPIVIRVTYFQRCRGRNHDVIHYGGHRKVHRRRNTISDRLLGHQTVIPSRNIKVKRTSLINTTVQRVLVIYPQRCRYGNRIGITSTHHRYRRRNRWHHLNLQRSSYRTNTRIWRKSIGSRKRIIQSRRPSPRYTVRRG